MSHPLFDRYSKQTAFPKFGVAGQQKLANATVVICGCGALGTSQANLLVRAGVGKVKLIDRDFVDLSNLQRQSLFDEQDVKNHLPKAVAAANRLRCINSEIEIDPVVADLSPTNIESLTAEADLILDGTDNFETRFLINDVSCHSNTPWIYGGCLGAEGQSMTVIPGQTPCLACLMPQGSPAAGALPTCDTGGILSGIIQAIAAIQVTQAMKLLTGEREKIEPQLSVLDLWDLRFRSVNLSKLRETGKCPVCVGQEFHWLSGKHTVQTHVLCGRNSVQLTLANQASLDLDQLAVHLSKSGTVLRNPYLLRFSKEAFAMTLFPDGRVIVSGTEDPSVAKTMLSQYVGI